MENITIGYGALLTALGLGGFIASGAAHKTALIPAGFGAAAIGLGLLAKRGKHRKRALRGARFVASLGLLGSARGFKKLPDLLRGNEVERPAAVISQSIMAGLCGAYLAASFLSSFTNHA